MYNTFVGNVLFAPKEVFGTNGKAVFQQKVVPLLVKFDAFLYGRKFVAGNQPTYVDFSYFEFAEMIKCFDEKTFNSLPSVKAYHASVAELPKIKVPTCA